MIDNKQVWDKGLGPATGMIFNQGSAGSSASQQMSPMQTQMGQTGQQDWNKYNVQKSTTNYNPNAMSGSTPVNTGTPSAPAAAPVSAPQAQPVSPAINANPQQQSQQKENPIVTNNKKFIQWKQGMLDSMMIDYQRFIDNGQANEAKQLRYHMDQIRKEIMSAQGHMSGLQ